MDNVTVAKETATTLGMKTQVNLNVIENVGLDVYFAIEDFDNVEGSGFSVTPKIVVTF